MFGRKKREKQAPSRIQYRLIQEKGGQRVDYVELELSRPIKPAKSRVEIVPSDKFE